MVHLKLVHCEHCIHSMIHTIIEYCYSFYIMLSMLQTSNVLKTLILKKLNRNFMNFSGLSQFKCKLSVIVIEKLQVKKESIIKKKTSKTLLISLNSYVLNYSLTSKFYTHSNLDLSFTLKGV